MCKEVRSSLMFSSVLSDMSWSILQLTATNAEQREDSSQAMFLLLSNRSICSLYPLIPLLSGLQIAFIDPVISNFLTFRICKQLLSPEKQLNIGQRIETWIDLKKVFLTKFELQTFWNRIPLLLNKLKSSSSKVGGKNSSKKFTKHQEVYCCKPNSLQKYHNIRRL